ncbi:MAG: hypothetical protein Q9163_000114 [Psora crenata]
METMSINTLVRPRHVVEALGVIVCYLVFLAIYRLYLSPLAKFPGPKLAALSLWYEFYYDVVKRGKYTWEIEKMHDKYGPIVRINPYELHIKDSDYHDELYVGSTVRRTHKWDWEMKMFGRSNSAFGTPNHELHHMRRTSLEPFLNTNSVQKLEPVIQSVVDKLVSRLHGLQGSGTPINMFDVFSSLTGDVTGEYAFAKDFGYLADVDFSPWWHKTIMDFSENGHKFKQFGWLEPMMRSMPRWFVSIVNPQVMSILNMTDRINDQINEAKANIAKGYKPTGHRTIFYDLLTNPDIPEKEKENERLRTEAQSVLVAGTVTAAHILTNIAFHIIDNPPVLEKLQAELRSVMPTKNSKPKWQELNQLVYMTAVVNEGLRISYGVVHRMQRVAPDVALRYKQWIIPANTPVGMSPKFMHDNPEVYPQPRKFIPDRFVKPQDPRVHKHMIVFGKGSRGCIGRDLAYCQMYLAIAALFAPDRFRFRLFETGLEDIETAHDFYNPSPRVDSKGVRVLVE